MCAHACVCVHACACVCGCVYVCVHACLCVQVCACVRMCVRVRSSVCLCVLEEKLGYCSSGAMALFLTACLTGRGLLTEAPAWDYMGTLQGLSFPGLRGWSTGPRAPEAAGPPGPSLQPPCPQKSVHFSVLSPQTPRSHALLE